MLRDYQIADLATVMQKLKWGLWHDPGGGKTPIAAGISQYIVKYCQGQVVWAQPKSLMHKNKREIERFAEGLRCVVVEGTPAQREQIMRREYDVYLMTFTGFHREYDFLKEHNPRIKGFIGDEWQRGYSTWESKRTQHLYAAQKRLDFLVPMTGSLITGRLESCFPAIHMINPRIYGHINNFKRIHGVYDEFGSVLQYRSHHILGNSILQTGTRRTFESIYGKESKVIDVRIVDMQKKHYEAYKEFHETAVLELEDIIISGETPSIKLMRARKLLNAPWEYGVLKPSELTGKEEYVVAEFDPPMVVFCTSPDEARHMGEVLEGEGYRIGVINGNTSGDERVRIDEDFQAGKLDGVVATQLTAGFGFNWGFIDRMIFMSMDWTDDAFLQAYRRGIRGKREKPLYIKVLEYENTIDQHIFRLIQRKSQDANLVDSSREVYILEGV